MNKIYILTIIGNGLLESVSAFYTLERAEEQFQKEIGCSYEDYLNIEGNIYNGLVGTITEVRIDK